MCLYCVLTRSTTASKVHLPTRLPAYRATDTADTLAYLVARCACTARTFISSTVISECTYPVIRSTYPVIVSTYHGTGPFNRVTYLVTKSAYNVRLPVVTRSTDTVAGLLTRSAPLLIRPWTNVDLFNRCLTDYQLSQQTGLPHYKACLR